MNFKSEEDPGKGSEQASCNARAHSSRLGRVFALDNDAYTLSRISVILESSGIEVKCFDQPALLLSEPPPSAPCCLILDIELGNDLHGIEIHRQLIQSGWRVPTLFLSACRDVPTVVDAMRNGAHDYLAKPFDNQELVKVVSAALEYSKRLDRDCMSAECARALVSTLTTREQEVVSLVVSGLLNKEIASKLHIALITVKVHRGRAMRKLGAGNAAELVRIAALGGIESD